MGAGIQRPFRARYGGLFCKWSVETILSWRGVFHFKEAKAFRMTSVCLWGSVLIHGRQYSESGTVFLTEKRVVVSSL